MNVNDSPNKAWQGAAKDCVWDDASTLGDITPAQDTTWKRDNSIKYVLLTNFYQMFQKFSKFFSIFNTNLFNFFSIFFSILFKIIFFSFFQIFLSVFQPWGGNRGMVCTVDMDLWITVPNSDTTIKLDFQSTVDQSVGDEWWGFSNLEINTATIGPDTGNCPGNGCTLKI